MLPSPTDVYKALMYGVLVIFAAFALTKPVVAQTPDLAVQATVRLEGVRGVCSGTVVAPNVALTAQHCLRSAGLFVIRDGVRYAIDGTMVPPTSKVDVALVHAPGIECPCAPMADADMESEVRALGWPRGKWSDTTGKPIELLPASAIFPGEDGAYLVHTAQIAPGSSGGGLWQLRDGVWYLVGVNVAAMADVNVQMIFAAAVPVADVLRALAQ